MSADLREHFTRKATAVGSTVTVSADGPSAREIVGGEAGDHSAIALFAVAETGSVAVALPREERGRCLLAERLWLLVPADELVPTLDVALERIEALVRTGTPYVTLMTGPSRTADIEMSLTVGVQGPARVVTIFVDDLS